MEKLTLKSGKVVEVYNNVDELVRLEIRVKDNYEFLQPEDIKEISEISERCGEKIDEDTLKYCVVGYFLNYKSYCLQDDGKQVFAPNNDNEIYFAVLNKVIGEGTFYA